MDKFVTTNALDALIQQVVAAPREKVVRVALEALQVHGHDYCSRPDGMLDALRSHHTALVVLVVESSGQAEWLLQRAHDR
jgi:hypothetical protein